MFFSTLCLLAFVWIGSFQIISVSGSELSYRTLLAGKRTVGLTQIASAKTQTGIRKLFGPFYRLVIMPKDSDQPIVVNMKILEKRDLQRLLSILGDKVIGAPKYSVVSNSE